jgi:hypothetical protein
MPTRMLIVRGWLIGCALYGNNMSEKRDKEEFVTICRDTSDNKEIIIQEIMRRKDSVDVILCLVGHWRDKELFLHLRASCNMRLFFIDPHTIFDLEPSNIYRVYHAHSIYRDIDVREKALHAQYAEREKALLAQIAERDEPIASVRNVFI